MLLLSCLAFLCILAYAIAVKILGLEVAARGVIPIEEKGGNGFALVANGALMAGGTRAVVCRFGSNGAWRAVPAAFAIDVDDLG